ncbi:MAG: hypothetical protein WBF43_01660 [Methylocella sp.]
MTLSRPGRQPPEASSLGVLYPTQDSPSAIQHLYQEDRPAADHPAGTVTPDGS